MPSPRHLLVVCGGRGYRCNAEDGTALRGGEGIVQVIPCPGAGLLLCVTSFDIEAIGSDGPIWRTRRIALDGMRGVRLDAGALVGLASTPMETEWLKFRVRLADGSVLGGWPEAEA